MGEQDNIKLAIGYGVGAGVALAGLLAVLGGFALSALGVGARIYVLAAVFVLGGIAIAVINALKLDRSALQHGEDGSE